MPTVGPITTTGAVREPSALLRSRMYVSKFRCTVLYAWMSVDGIQICVDGVAEAMVAVRPHSANAARAIPIRWMLLLLFFMVPPWKMECRVVPG